jgi:hypothetical protein
MFQHPLLASIDRRKNYGEERWVGIGILKGIIAVSVYIEDNYNKKHTSFPNFKKVGVTTIQQSNAASLPLVATAFGKWFSRYSRLFPGYLRCSGFASAILDHQ